MKYFIWVLFGLLVAGPAIAQPMKTYEIIDAQGFGAPITAYTVSVPQSWSAEGQIVWNKPCSGNDYFELIFTARSPDGRTGYRIMPGFQISWINSVVSGFDPQLAQIVLAQDEAQRNEMRTKFRNSNCHVGQVTGSDQLLQELVLTNRPAGTVVKKTVRDEATLAALKTTFEVNQPGMKSFYDALVVELEYPLGGAPVEETLFFSWYLFQFEPLDPTMGTFLQQTFVDSLRFAWLAPERRQADQAELAAIVGSLKVNPVWDQKIAEFYRKIAKNSQATAAERERQRQLAEARRDVQHQQFLEYIQQ